MNRQSRILVVDDNPTNLKVLVKPLQKAGYETLEASDGFKAVELAMSELPDLILLDVMMPDRDGLEVARILRANESTASIPVIFVTASAASKDIVNAFSAGGSDYVTKPVKIDEVMARVSVQLRVRRAEMELVERNEQLTITSQQLERANAELAKLARIDALTGLLNRGAWDETAKIEHERSMRSDLGYAIGMIDIDHFKLFNDSLGHRAGDDCLRLVAQCVRLTCRTFDCVGRYGGEEFIVLAPEATLEKARGIAERLRQAVWDLAIAHPSSPAGRVTVSIGVACCLGEELGTVIEAADQALYRAKSGGRNLVETHGGGYSVEGDLIEEPLPSDFEIGRLQESDDAMHILVVDDNATNRLLCKGCLEREGYRVSEARDGYLALESAKKDHPTVIVMDVMMPNMDGLECTRLLKADADLRHIPVIIVSACADASDVVAGLEAGADEYLTKPIRTRELCLRVDSMARLQRERRSVLRSYQLRGEQIRLLVLLLDFCRSLGDALSRKNILDLTISTAAQACGCRRVSIMFPDETGRHLCIGESTGIDPEIAKTVRVPVGTGIAGRVFESRESIILNADDDMRSFSIAYDSPFFVSAPMLSTPLGSAGKVVGVLNLAERINGLPFGPRELEYTELIAGIAGSVVHANISQQARDNARDLTLVALAKLAENRDSDTCQHVDRVTQYALTLAEELAKGEEYGDQIDEDFLHGMKYAVPLHDIGKVAIPDAILRKPGRLTVEEMAIMRTHSDIGAETLRRVMKKAPEAEFFKPAIDIIQSHHEWYDGSGYPKGLKETQIPLSARITAIADVYDALTSKRVYKDAISHEAAVKIIQDCSGTQFDPVIVRAFLRLDHVFADLAVKLADHPDSPRRAPTHQVPEAHHAGAI